MASRETLERLRDVLARELETISIYERHAEAEADPDAKRLFQHLADEEKEHVTEVYEALLIGDPVQKKWASSGEHAQAIREGRFEASTPALGPTAEKAAPPAKAVEAAPRVRSTGAKPTPPTVGSLLGQAQQGGSV